LIIAILMQTEVEEVGTGEKTPLIVRLQAIAAFVDVFEEPGFVFGEWEPHQVVDGFVTPPVFYNSSEASRFIGVCSDLGWVSREGNWTLWLSTPEATRLFEESGAVEQATYEQLSQMLTAMIRQERFGEGSLDGYYQSGLLLRVLQRAKALLIELTGKETD
jgi:hypothetical protein